MPEYLAPGVYVEETSFRAKSIEGVSTTTTGFIGPARYGPTNQPLDVITSVGEFEYTYGDRQQLQFLRLDAGQVVPDGRPMHNYLWHGARAFFSEGGRRLYAVRVFRRLNDADQASQRYTDANGRSYYNDGCARALLPAAGTPPDQVEFRARFPGAAGNARLRLTLRLGQNLLTSVQEPAAGGGTTTRTVLGALSSRDLVLLTDVTSPPSPATSTEAVYLAEPDPAPTPNSPPWRFVKDAPSLTTTPAFSPPSPVGAGGLRPVESDSVRVLTLTLTYLPPAGDPVVWDSLPIDPAHTSFGQKDSLTALFADDPASAAQARTLPVVIIPGTNIVSGIDVLRAILGGSVDLLRALTNPDSTDLQRSVEIELTGGNDGRRPGPTEYQGEAPADQMIKTGLEALADIEDISIVAAPGSTYGYERTFRAEARAITGLLIRHAEQMRYRIAVLDSGDAQSIADVRALRATMDSKYAALYYPWVKLLDPVTRQEIILPPSGFVAGIYARNDVERAVYKAPANEVVGLALGFEQNLNKAQQDLLNPEGINCFRFFEGRGFRLWGARTISSDPEWKYVNLRRYFAYLERSIDKGTQWAVFEPNGERLWANVRRTIEDFLLNEWQSGALLGDRPDRAYFVRCDRTTMTQNDLDNGRLICLIGVAALRPAEFVIFRIGQWTGDRR